MTEYFKDCCNCQGTRSDRICSDGCKRARRVLESLTQEQSVEISRRMRDTYVEAFEKKGVDSIEQED